MRTPAFTLCAALAVAALTPAPASAADRAPGTAPGAVAVTPSAVAPGTEAALQVTGCAGRTGRATSEVFVDAVPLGRVAAGLVGDARVRSSAEPGAYAVAVHCDGEDARATGTIEVTSASPAPPEDAGTAAYAHPAQDAATPPASPTAPVRAGGGGTAKTAARHVAAAPPKALRTTLVRTAASREGDGAYAVGLVLAGGAVLALTGQLLRMRRRRKGSGDGDAG
ncbi:hypothetical protein ACH4OW_13940 [Streptomyces sp. NPDC017056]|uniref:hypothetical protein n=1 Tax=Streptomyces sp. NPDC017056 TaxID=3364973 RepID=UPI0037AD5F80